MKLDELQLDDRIIHTFGNKGITQLYPPQVEALPHVLAGKNLLMAVPTASGKSLVAYIACVQRALEVHCTRAA